MRDKGIGQLRRGESRVRVAVINVAADLSPCRQKRKRFFAVFLFLNWLPKYTQIKYNTNYVPQRFG